MKKNLFDKILHSVKEMQDIRAGTVKPARKTVLTPDHPKAVRAQLGISQEDFAHLLGVPLGTLRNWEQGIRQPVGAARTLLKIAAKHPSILKDALHAA